MTSVKAIIFAIDDVLYDAFLQKSNARLSAVKAMIEAGLPVDVETGYRKLEEIVKELGPNNNRHFDSLLEKLGLKWDPAVVAAGVVAYRNTNPVFLKPYPDTVPTLLRLREMGLKLGIASSGRSVKEWEKLINLGLQHLFQAVVVSEDLKLNQLTEQVLEQVTRQLNVSVTESAYVGVNPDSEINVANRAGLISIRLRKGGAKLEEGTSNPRYEINKLSEIIQLISKL
ncbi:MAG TPA: HAD family hydrolase [Candidatus Bathyarchaeia archaeon]|nr:HAD family hydrolase [Candidatus Bathyarchaeia archaeon]